MPSRLLLLTKKLLSLYQFFSGITNDKNIARYDVAIKKFYFNNEALDQMRWGAFDKDGNNSRQLGAYFIYDRGYHYWKQLIASFKSQIYGSKMERWSANVKSARKDVDCTFRILKKRLLFLKNPIKLHSPERIEDAFHTCGALHNWLHEYNVWDNWEERSGVVDQDDVVMEYDPCNKHNVTYLRTSFYSTFTGNFIRSVAMRRDANAYCFDN